MLFPDEIIFHILHFLDPCDAIRLRLVSKQFNSVTRDARLWRTLYTNSRLLRPSGPFLWQSTQFLERVLIHSARVSRTWTSCPMNVVSRVCGPRIPIQPSPISTAFDFLFGRLFIWCEGEQLLAQDLETGVGRLLWESTEPISSLNACSLTLPDGEHVFIALRHVDEPVSERTPMHVHFPLISFFPDPDRTHPSKLLEFPLQDDVRLMLGPMTFEMDLPECANFPLSATAPFLYFDGGAERLFGHIYQRMVMDAQTRAIYIFPAFSSGIDAAIPDWATSWWYEFTLLSGRYIMVFHPWCYSDPPTTHIQAFVAPDPLAHLSDADIGQLRLTHEVVTHEVLAGYPHGLIRCLRDAIVDPVTGEVHIRCLSSNVHRGQTHFLCVDITIPPENSASTEVLSMSVNAQELLVFSGERRNIFFDTSNDGHGRGIITLSPSEFPEPQAGPGPVVLYKFSIDAGGEHCTAMVSEPSDLSPQDAVFRYAEYHIFDGVRGRICHDLETNHDSFDLEVLGLH